MRMFIAVILLCLLLEAVLCHPRGGGRDRQGGGGGRRGRGGRGGGGGRGDKGEESKPRGGGIKQLTDEQSEKRFFCQIAHRACKLETGGDEPLVDRTCPNDAPCDGPSATVSLDGKDYTVTLCARPKTREEAIQAMLTREKPAPSEALQDICKPPEREGGDGEKKPEDKPVWYGKACEVTRGEETLVAKECRREGATCSLGPFDAELDGDVKVMFCDGTGEEEKKPLWYMVACSVTQGETKLKEEKCPRGLKCITRLTNMAYDGGQVDVGFCGGVLPGKGKRGKGKPRRRGGRKN